jgi:Ca-activated chloride channel homolog
MMMPNAVAATGFVARTDSEPLKLAMQRLWLTGRVLPVGAQLWVSHEFQSQESRPVEVIYSFALPRDATLRRFRMRGDNFTVDSELRPTAEAVKVYEDGIRAGSLSSLARQYADGLVNLTVGNVRPQEKVVVLLEILAGVELHDCGLRLRFPFTLAPAYHPQARVIEVKPGVGEMELPAADYGDLILPQFACDASGLHQVGFCLEIEAGETEEIASPSHTLRVQKTDERHGFVSLARESDLPDRDLVLDVRTKPAGAILMSGAEGSGKGRFAAVIPSTDFGAAPGGPRRIVILLDRSGSMGGTPIAQARKAIEACLAALDPADQFGIIAFDNQIEGFGASLFEASAKNRQSARKFLSRIEARGGTELAGGLEAAARLLGGERGDIFILTDGQVFATEIVLERARSTGSRVHCLGIGSASQDRFLAQLAGHTGGVCRFLTPSERVDLPAVELFAAVGRPVAEEIRVSLRSAEPSGQPVDGARIAPEPCRSVFSGTPLLVMGEIPTAREAQLQIAWQDDQKHLRFPLHFAPSPLADTLRLLQGSRIIADLESRYLPAERSGAARRKESSRAAELLRDLGREFGLSNSEMSLVAVMKRPGDTAGEIPGTRIVPVGMPQDTLFESCFAAVPAAMPPPKLALGRAGLARELRFSVRSVFSKQASGTAAEVPAWSPAPGRGSIEDLLIKLIASLEPDGGMPGKAEQARVANSLALLLFLIEEGNTRDAGPFRLHVERLLRFLAAPRLLSLEPERAALASRALQVVSAACRAPGGDWASHGHRLESDGHVDGDVFWRDLAAALAP